MTGKRLTGGRGLAALTICLAATACATQRAPVSPQTAPTATPKATPAATASARPAATLGEATAVPPRQRAVEDATAILAAFVPPPGAVRLAKVPAAASLLRQPPESLAVTNLIDDASLWRVPMAPGAVLDWERAHLPHRFDSAAGIGSGGNVRGQRFYDSSWSLVPLYGVLAYRTLVVAVQDVGNGQTVVRADAQVMWLDRQPAARGRHAGHQRLYGRAADDQRKAGASSEPGRDPGARVPRAATIVSARKVLQVPTWRIFRLIGKPGRHRPRSGAVARGTGHSPPSSTGSRIRLTPRCPGLPPTKPGLTSKAALHPGQRSQSAHFRCWRPATQDRPRPVEISP